MISGIICLLASVAVYFQQESELYLKLFPVFLLLSNIVQNIGSFLAVHNEANVFLYNIYSVIEFTFYFFILSQIIRDTKMKKIIFYVLWIYPLFAILNVFVIRGTPSFHSIAYASGSLMVVGFCVFYFYELFQFPHSNSLLRDPAFWICTAIVFNNCLTFPLASFAIFIHNPSRFIVQNVVIIQNIINIFSYLLLTIAFLCRIRIKKSMSSS